MIEQRNVEALECQNAVFYLCYNVILSPILSSFLKTVKTSPAIQWSTGIQIIVHCKYSFYNPVYKGGRQEASPFNYSEDWIAPYNNTNLFI